MGFPPHPRGWLSSIVITTVLMPFCASQERHVQSQLLILCHKLGSYHLPAKTIFGLSVSRAACSPYRQARQESNTVILFFFDSNGSNNGARRELAVIPFI